VIDLSTVVARIPLPIFALYCATKAFFEAMTDALRAEYEPERIWFNLVQGGVMTTPFYQTAQQPDWQEIANSYGRVSDVQIDMALRIEALITEMPDEVRPELIAAEIVKLAQRSDRGPERTVIGLDWGACAAVNAAAEQDRQDLLAKISPGP